MLGPVWVTQTDKQMATLTFLSIQQLLELGESHEDYLPDGGTSLVKNQPSVYL